VEEILQSNDSLSFSQDPPESQAQQSQAKVELHWQEISSCASHKTTTCVLRPPFEWKSKCQFSQDQSLQQIMNAFLTWGYFVDICYGAKSIVTIYMKVYVCDEEVSNVMRRVKRSGCGLRE
jgi:hypothetical protein